jgi:glycosyltransferase involved in cell wall biosynthesis
MKNILYIHQYFKTPEEGGALRSYFIARELAKRGCKIHVLTAHNQPRYEHKEIERILVHYLPVPYSNNMSFGQRHLAFLKFVFASIIHTYRLPKPDLVFATSTPLTVGIIALWLKWQKSIPYIFEVRDLWPEAPIRMGILKNPIVKKLALKLEKLLYKKASAIVALSPGIEAGIKKKYTGTPVTMIPNMADVSFYGSNTTSQKSSGILTIGYFGAFGMANNVEFIMDIARVCQHQRLPIQFILAGEGSKKEFIEKSIQQPDLKNIELFPMKNRFEIGDLMKQVDACLTTFLNIPVLETNSPNKFFDGLAAGKLVVVNSGGWLRTLVEKHECGIYIDALRPEEFTEKMKPFLEDRTLLARYQQNARKLASSEFSKEALLEKAVLLVSAELKKTNI